MPRPPGYQRDAVLDRATDLFWQRGYGATSINDLVAATGLKPGSLYAAFGSKKALFLEVLDGYHAGFMRDIEAGLATADGPLAGLRALFSRMADDTLGASRERGCLAVNALLEMSQHDEDIAGNLRRHSERLRQRLEAILQDAADRGELAPGSDPKALSSFLLNNLWGMRVLCKHAPTREGLDGIVDSVMRALTGART